MDVRSAILDFYRRSEEVVLFAKEKTDFIFLINEQIGNCLEFHLSAEQCFDFCENMSWICDRPEGYYFNSFVFRSDHHNVVWTYWNLKCDKEGFFILDENKKNVAFIPIERGYHVALRAFDTLARDFAPRRS